MWNVFDQYELRARLAPTILLLLPIAAFLAVFIPVDKLTLGVGIASGVIGLAILYFVAQLTGYFGRRLQPTLFEQWDGAPSTRFLRWRDDHFTVDQKQAIAAVVQKQFRRSLPTAEQEAADPSQADRRITEIFNEVRHHLHTNKVEGLWRSHLAEYGLARNLIGSARPVGALSIGLTIASFVLACSLSDSRFTWTGVFCLLWAALLIVGHHTFLKALAKHLGERYADSAWMAFLHSAKKGD